MKSTRLSKVIDSLVSADPSIFFGLHHGLINLSKLARFLAPLIQTRVGKVSLPALIMALSRYQRTLPAKVKRREAALKFKGVRRQRELVLLTIPKVSANIRKTHTLVSRMHTAYGYMNMTEGDRQYALIIQKDKISLTADLLSESVKSEAIPVEAIILTFDRGYIPRPGVLYLILQQLALQQINIIELASTSTEFILFLDPGDVEVAERTLLKRFGKGKVHGIPKP